MEVKFEITDEIWEAFLQKTSSPGETLRELVTNYLDVNFPLNMIIGVDNAAKIWGLAPGTIKNLCAGEQVKCMKVGQTWVLSKNQPNPKKRINKIQKTSQNN